MLLSFFALGAKEIKFKGPYQAKDKDEDGLMAVRWRYFNFCHEILEILNRAVPVLPTFCY